MVFSFKIQGFSSCPPCTCSFWSLFLVRVTQTECVLSEPYKIHNWKHPTSCLFLSCIILSHCYPPVRNRSLQMCQLILLSNGKLTVWSWNSHLPQVYDFVSGYCTSSPFYFSRPQIYVALLVWCSFSLNWKTTCQRYYLEHIAKLSSLGDSAWELMFWKTSLSWGKLQKLCSHSFARTHGCWILLELSRNTSFRILCTEKL